MGGMRISVHDSEQLQAVLTAMVNLDRTTQSWIRKGIVADGTDIWQEEVRGHVTTALETRVLSDTARVRPSNQNVQLTSATIGRRLRGGGTPAELVKATEFGANRQSTSTYRTRKGHTVTRHTTRQFKSVNRKGYAVYPAFARSVPRFAALFAQTVARGVYDALEGKAD